MKKQDYIKENGCANSVNGFLIIIIAVIVVFIFGCNPYPKEKESVNIIKRDTAAYVGYIDVPAEQSGNLYLDTIPYDRFFLVSYATKRINIDVSNINGHFTWRSATFPSKGEIDSVVYSVLKFKKSCYEDIVITSIFEFNDQEDYEQFSKGWTTKNKYQKRKLKCQ